MIEIVFRGRLGNQMFQYAYGSTLAARVGCELSFDVGWYYRAPEPFDLWRFAATGLRPVTLASEVVGRIAEKLRFLRPMPDYDMYDSRFEPRALEVADGTRLNGWFQSLRYFESDAERIRTAFDLTPFRPEDDLVALRQAAAGRALAAVHVRRGDYVNNPHFFLDDYDAFYIRAFDHLAATIGAEPYLVILSDDPEWCRQWPLLQGRDHHVYDPPTSTSNLQDLAVMAACDHNVITNSSFSWWGAWLGVPQDRCVVMPRRWFPEKTTIECGMDVPGWVQL
jgi:hypothetical protein